MGMKLRVLLWVLTVLFFGYNFFLWGGLKDTPLIGAQLMEEAPFDSPLAATYMFFGTKVNGTLRQREAAREFAARRFPELVNDPSKVEYLAVQRFLAAQSVGGKLCYYLAPVLLVLSLVLHWTRQKKIKAFGAR